MRGLILAVMAIAGIWSGGLTYAGTPPTTFTDRLEGDAPGTVQVGTSIALGWAAISPACSYDGSTFPAGVRFDNWPVNAGGPTTAPVCNNTASCSAPHPTTLFLSVPGSYRFVVTCLSFGGPQATSSIDVIAVQAPTSERVALNLSASTPGPVRPGASFDYTLSLNNNGGFRLSAPTTTLALPGEVGFVSSTCATASSGNVVWSLPNGLAAGDNARCKVSVRLNSIPAGDVISASASTSFSILSSSFSLRATEQISTLRRSRPLSLRRDGAPTTLDSVSPVISGDGSLVLFSTRQRGLTADDSNTGGADIVLKNRRDGSARVVSVRTSDGVALRGSSTSPTISANGRALAFVYEPLAPTGLKAGESGQLCSAPPNGLFRPTCTTTAPNGQPLSGPAEGPSMSADGKLMAFCSSASNWVNGDGNGAKDVFVMDMTSSAVTLVSTNAAGVQGNGDSCDAMISGNAKYVVFRTRATNLGGTSNWQVVRKNLESGQIERLSQDSAGAAANADAGRPSVSYNGQRVAFASRANNLVAGLLGGNNKVYIYYTPGGAAIGLDGGVTKEIGNGLFGVRNTVGNTPNGDSDDPVISCNGGSVAFGSSASDLISGDVGGTKDVFVVDAQTGSARRAQATGSGEPNGPSTSPAMNCEGTALVFQSSANNVDPGDPNPNTDVYVQEDPQGADGGTPGTLGGAVSGNWFNPGQSGHGYLVEALPDGRYYLTWYLYVDGQPLFLQGVGPAQGNVVDVPVYSTRSTGFPVGTSGVTNSSWGRLKMTFNNNDTASVEWTPTAFGFSAGTMTLRRLTVPALAQSDPPGAVIKACYSGIWFEPARSGYGFNLEVIEQGEGNRAVVAYWYTYRPDGSPLWLSGVGRPAGGQVRVDLYQGGGSGAQFPFNFVSDSVTQTLWGSATLRFTSNNTLEVAYTPALSGYAAGSANLVRLTELSGRACVN
ncbi:MAG: PD40 domain-containing protein [Rhodanobacteraceae bacterium]|nr:PD40 domain-containing protein [Rhodanobacteraceae bacterium]